MYRLNWGRGVSTGWDKRIPDWDYNLPHHRFTPTGDDTTIQPESKAYQKVIIQMGRLRNSRGRWLCVSLQFSEYFLPGSHPVRVFFVLERFPCLALVQDPSLSPLFKD